MSDELQSIGQAIRVAAEHREQERIAANQERGPAHLFIPDGDPELEVKGFGVGYWVEKDQIVAYRKMANGYKRYPDIRFDVEFLKKLIHVWESRQ